MSAGVINKRTEAENGSFKWEKRDNVLEQRL